MGGSSGGGYKPKQITPQDFTPGTGPAIQAAANIPANTVPSLENYVPKPKKKVAQNPLGLSGNSLVNYQALAARRALESLGVPVSRLGA